MNDEPAHYEYRVVCADGTTIACYKKHVHMIEKRMIGVWEPLDSIGEYERSLCNPHPLTPEREVQLIRLIESLPSEETTP